MPHGYAYVFAHSLISQRLSALRQLSLLSDDADA